MDNKVIHDLTILYLSKQDLSSLTPERLCDEYKKTYEAIEKHYESDNEPFVQVI